MKTEQEKIEWQKQAYGCTQAELDEGIESALFDKAMLAMSILSDAQHVLEFDSENGKETARQFMNQAKYVISLIKTEARQQEMS